MEKRALFAVVLSTLVFVGYTYFFSPEPPPQKAPEQQATTTVQKAGTAPTTTAVKPAAAPATQAQAAPQPAHTGPVKKVTVDNGLVKYVFSEVGGRLISAKLDKFREARAESSPLKELIHVTDPNLAPFGLSTFKGSIPGLDKAVFALEGPDGDRSARDKAVSVVFRWTDAAGVEVVKRYTIHPGNYLFDLKVELANRSPKAIDDNLILDVTALNNTKEGGRYAFRGFAAYVDEKLTESDLGDLADAKKDKEKIVVNGDVAWGGYENSYFLQAFVANDAEGSVRGLIVGGEGDNRLIQARFTSQPLSIPAGGATSFQFGGYFGPKDIDTLTASGHDLEKSIYMGFFDIVAKPLLYFLKWAYDLVGNYGLAIIIMTIAVKILFWPLTQKSYKSMRGMQSLQPEMQKLREKYKGDKQRLNQEMMGLYKAHKVNPMGGCLPMVIQIPVFFALYRLLDYAIELRHAPFMLWINDLSAPDRLFRFPFDIPMMDPPSGIPVLTLLMGASMFITQKMTPTPGDPTQAKIMLLMPIVFTFIFINFPSGLVLYWLVQNILSIGQQYYVNKKKN